MQDDLKRQSAALPYAARRYNSKLPVRFERRGANRIAGAESAHPLLLLFFDFIDIWRVVVPNDNTFSSPTYLLYLRASQISSWC